MYFFNMIPLTVDTLSTFNILTQDFVTVVFNAQIPLPMTDFNDQRNDQTKDDSPNNDRSNM